MAVSAHQTTSSVYPGLTYDDAPAAIEWLCRAFGFVRRLVVPGPDGTVRHSELSHGSGVVFVNSPRAGEKRVSPRSLDGSHELTVVYVEDPDGHCVAAEAAGAEVMERPADSPQGRGYTVRDLEGHLWHFGTYRPGAHWEGAPPVGFAVIYRWRLHEGRETEFVAGWEKLTDALARERGALGSRLHQTPDGAWVGYAQWPSRAVWQNSTAGGSPDPEASAAMAAAVAEAEEPIELVPILDRLH